MENNGVRLAGQLNQRMQELARELPGNVEFSGYLIGDNPDTFTHINFPKKLLGLDVDNQDKIKLKELTDPLGITSTMIGVDRVTGELGLQVVASKEGATQDKSQFFPLSTLILGKPLSEFMPDQMTSKIFPSLSRNEITNDMLIEAIEAEETTVTHTYLENTSPSKTIKFLPIPLDVDMFGGKRSLHPVSTFTIDALSANKSANGGIYGVTHVHYGFTDQEREQQPIINRLAKIDEGFARFISPDDAMQVINSRSIMKRISKGQIDMAMGLLGVTALNPVSKEIIGSSYFNYLNLTLPENERELREFKDISAKAYGSLDIEALKDFFSCVAGHSPAVLPNWVESLVEGGISS